MGSEAYIYVLNEMLTKRCTPRIVKTLEPDEIFVFGTNPDGKHTSQAAQLAVLEFGAKMGEGEGLFGQSYAIPVHKHQRSRMVEAVARFIEFARTSPDKKYYVLAIGCGAAGMDSAFVALMFRKAIEIENICLPKLFIEELIRYYEIGVEISEDCLTVERFPMHRNEKYKVPYGVEILGESSFMGCSCELELPQSLKRIEKWAFCDMGDFDFYLRIPSSVTYIHDKAFESEWVSPGMLVSYQSYAYYYAKDHGQRYKCLDFDEENDLKEKKQKNEKENRKIHGLTKITSIPRGRFMKHIECFIPKGNIAIADGFAVVLNDDGHLTLVGNNDQFHQFFSISRIVKVAATSNGVMALTNKGNVLTFGIDSEYAKEIERWRDVCDIVGCEDHALAIQSDGRVLCIDGPGDWTFSPNHFKIVREWRNIKQIAAGFGNVMGLTHDGHVLYHSEDGNTNDNFYDKYNDVVQIDAYSHYYGTDSSMVLHKDGTVSSDTFEEVNNWRNIVQIAVGNDIGIGLKNNGTLEVVDYNCVINKEGEIVDDERKHYVKNWKGIVCVECKFSHIVGISADGRILSTFESK